MGHEDYGVWRDVKRGSGFVARYGLLFDGCRRRWHWWVFADTLQSVIVSVAAGAEASSWIGWAIACQQIAWVFGLALSAPFRQWADRVVALLLSALCAAAAVLGALDMDEGVGNALMTAAACVALVGSLAPVVAELQAFKALRSDPNFHLEGIGQSAALCTIVSGCARGGDASRGIQDDSTAGVKPKNRRVNVVLLTLIELACLRAASCPTP